MTKNEFYEEWLEEVNTKIESLEKEKENLKVQCNKLSLKCEIYTSRSKLEEFFDFEIQELNRLENEEKQRLDNEISIYSDLRNRIDPKIKVQTTK